jgi:Ca-activated chloride channel family protein
MWLWALLVIPVLVVFAVRWERQRTHAATAFADPRVMAVGSDPSARLYRRIALGLAIVAAAMGPVALARPAMDTTEEKRQGAVMLAIDTSESMRKTDLAPDRLAAAREAANRFLDEAPQESLIGLVSFNDRAVVQVAPTLDRVAVRAARARRGMRPGPAPGAGGGGGRRGR